MSFRKYKKNIHKIEIEQKKRSARRRSERMLTAAITAMETHRDNYIVKAKRELELGNSVRFNANLTLLKETLLNITKANDMLKNVRIALALRETQGLNTKLIRSIDCVLKDVCKTEKTFSAAISQELFDGALLSQSNNAAMLMELLKNNNYPFSNSAGSYLGIVDSEARTLVGGTFASP